MDSKKSDSKKSDLKRSETIQLDYPITLADRVVEEVTMQRPSMKVLREHVVKGDQDITGEMKLLLALTELRMEELEEMDAADYARLQDIFIRFRTPSKP